MNRWLKWRRQVWGELRSPGTRGTTNGHGMPVALSQLAPGSMWKPLSWTEQEN